MNDGWFFFNVVIAGLPRNLPHILERNKGCLKPNERRVYTVGKVHKVFKVFVTLNAVKGLLLLGMRYFATLNMTKGANKVFVTLNAVKGLISNGKRLNMTKRRIVPQGLLELYLLLLALANGQQTQYTRALAPKILQKRLALLREAFYSDQRLAVVVQEGFYLDQRLAVAVQEGFYLDQRLAVAMQKSFISKKEKNYHL